MIVFVMLLLSIIFLYIGSQYVVKSAVELSLIHGISKFSIGFFLIAFLTSLPELSVSLLSIAKESVEISIGNIIGSNIANLSLVLGLMILIGGPVLIEEATAKKLIKVLFYTSLIPILIILQGELSIFSGLLLILFFFLGFLRQEKKKFAKKIGATQKQKILTMLVFFGSLVTVLFSADLLVRSAIEISEIFNLSKTFIGATIVAIGTSLPELSIGLFAAIRKELHIAISEIFGSCIINLSLILGSVALFSSVHVGLMFSTLIPFLWITNVAVWYMVETFGKITRHMALMLILIYIAFILQESGIIVFYHSYDFFLE